MNAPGKTMHDNLAKYARQLSDGSVLNFNDIQCECTMHTSQVLLDYGPRSEKHAPYLHFIGEVRRVAFPQEMKPYMHGIDALTFPEGAGLQTDVFYKFNRHELTEMVQKGYFDENFEMPDIFYDNDFDLPMSCNLMMVQPDRVGTPPIIFVGLNNPRSMEFTSESSGYDLGSYFDFVPEKSAEKSTVHDYMQDGVHFESEMDDDLFGNGYEQPVDTSVAEKPSFETPAVNDSDLETRRLMEQYSQIEANVDARRNRTRADVDRDIQVASGVDVTEVESVPAPVAEQPVAESVAKQSELTVAPVAPEKSEPDTSDDISAVEESVVSSADEISTEPVVEDDEDDTKSEKAARQAAIAANNQDDNQERKPIPAHLENMGQYDNAEFVDDDEFADGI